MAYTVSIDVIHIHRQNHVHVFVCVVGWLLCRACTANDKCGREEMKQTVNDDAILTMCCYGTICLLVCGASVYRQIHTVCVFVCECRASMLCIHQSALLAKRASVSLSFWFPPIFFVHRRCLSRMFTGVCVCIDHSFACMNALNSFGHIRCDSLHHPLHFYMPCIQNVLLRVQYSPSLSLRHRHRAS